MGDVHKGWSGGGRLPHFDAAETTQHVVFRLADALPPGALAELARIERAERLEAAETTLDAGSGSCALGDARLARVVQAALLHFDGVRYRLHAWCVMPTHVHVLATQAQGWPLADVVHAWKSFTAHQANSLVGRSGRFWARDYFDRFMRDGDQADAALSYIENNPVAAGLCAEREAWPWSSASRRAAVPAACGRDARGPFFSEGGRPGRLRAGRPQSF
jgi:REP element-mobilizing transposase RayT